MLQDKKWEDNLKTGSSGEWCNCCVDLGDEGNKEEKGQRRVFHDMLKYCQTHSEVSRTVQLVAHADVLIIFVSSPKNLKLLSVDKGIWTEKRQVSQSFKYRTKSVFIPILLVFLSIKASKMFVCFSSGLFKSN